MLADAHCGAAIMGAATRPAPAPGGIGSATILEGVADEAAEAAGLTSEEEARALQLIEASLLAVTGGGGGGVLVSSQAAMGSTAASPPLHERLSRPASHEKLAMGEQPADGPATPTWKSAAGGGGGDGGFGRAGALGLSGRCQWG